MQCSLVPRIAWPRLSPSSAAQPDPGSRLLHGDTPSRRYAQRVRWRRLPPIEAMFRSCSDALCSNAREMAGYRWTTLGVRHVAHPRQRADVQAAVGPILDSGQRQVVDVDEMVGVRDAGADQIHLGGPAGKERAGRMRRRQRERVVGVGRPAVGQRSHAPPPAPSRICRIAARMFG
jgi:hypothetical protein